MSSIFDDVARFVLILTGFIFYVTASVLLLDGLFQTFGFKWLILPPTLSLFWLGYRQLKD